MLSVIFGCAGTSLSPEERAFFRDQNPLGFILFARNIESPDQLRRLTDELRHSVDRDSAPILIDQEGGRVQRLKPPHWRSIPSAMRFGALTGRGLDLAVNATRLNHRLIAEELRELGIDVDCAPLVDLRFEGASDVIGDRAFGEDVETVSTLGRAAAEGLMAGGVTPIIKHIPGHGRALVDSHFELPVVAAGRAELSATDFQPFHRLREFPWAMTAHVVYEAIDPGNPATLSPKVVEEVIRGEIGFDGLLISDDLSMKALRGSLDQLAKASLDAGCDVVLHCNGQMDEMRLVASGTRALSDVGWNRYERGRNLAKAAPCDLAALKAELTALVA